LRTTGGHGSLPYDLAGFLSSDSQHLRVDDYLNLT
jgi:hypothetical protein